MIVGVAGKYCSGKSTITACLIERGFLEIDLDLLGHNALVESTAAIAERFTAAVLDEKGLVDRKKLGSIVFADREKRLLLEEILHPKMVEMARTIVAEQNRKSGSHRNIVIDGALLFYMGLDKLCDIAIWVSTPCLTRLVRARKRDRLPLSSLLQRFRSQRDLTPQPSSNDVDIYYIRNTGSPAALMERLDRILP